MGPIFLGSTIYGYFYCQSFDKSFVFHAPFFFLRVTGEGGFWKRAKGEGMGFDSLMRQCIYHSASASAAFDGSVRVQRILVAAI